MSTLLSRLTGGIAGQRALKNAAVLLGGRGISAAAGLAAIAISARTLGPTLFGTLVLIQTYVVVIDGILNFQSWQALVKFGTEALVAEDRDGFSSTIKTGFYLDAFSAIAAAIVAVLLMPAFMSFTATPVHLTPVILWYCFTIVTRLAGMPTAVLQVFDRFRLISLHRIASALVKLLAVSIAAGSGGGLRRFILAFLVADVFANFILFGLGLVVLRAEGFSGWFGKRTLNWQRVVSFGFWTNIISTVDMPVKQLDIFVVGAVLSLESVGVYKIIKAVANVFVELASPLFTALYPENARHLAVSEERKSWQLSMDINRLLGTVFFPLALITGATSNLWVPLVFGPQYLGQYTAMLLLVFFTAISASNMAIHPHFIAAGFVRWNFWIISIANVMYLVLAVFLGGRLALVGISFAYLAQMLLVILPKYFISITHLKKIEV